MKSVRLLLFPLLVLLAGCASSPEQAKSASRPSMKKATVAATQPQGVYVPVTGSGGSTGLQQFRR